MNEWDDVKLTKVLFEEYDILAFWLTTRILCVGLGKWQGGRWRGEDFKEAVYVGRERQGERREKEPCYRDWGGEEGEDKWSC